MPDHRSANNYKEEVTDEQLLNLIEAGVQNSVGDWLNSSDLTRERLRSTYEYAGVADFHLAPQGVSTIVDTSTTEVIEAYTAVLSELFLNNNKIARFMPYNESAPAYKMAHDASNLVNYGLFKQNKGWEIMQTWFKSALLWKNAIIRWDYVEDFDYCFEEYDEIDQERLDTLLAEDDVEIVGELEYDDSTDALENPQVIFKNVRIRRTVNKSKVKVENVPPENFRISRDAKSIEEAAFVGIQFDMTRSEICLLYTSPSPRDS